MRVATILWVLMYSGWVFAGDKCQDLKYEPSHNQIEVGPWTVKRLAGYVEDPRKSPLAADTCVRLFTDREHKFVSGIATNAKGEFRLSTPPEGDYRVVVSCDGFCSANFGVHVRRGGSGKKVVIHMFPRTLDGCSWSELK